MVRTIIAILSALSIIARQVMEWMERKRIAEEKAEQERKDAEHQQAIDKLEEDPSEWFVGHFSDAPARVVRPPPVPKLRAGDTSAEADSKRDSD